jgi:protein gp37
MDRTGIEWTDATWNPVRGCSRVSAGCENCYAMRQAHRTSGRGGAYEGLTTIRKGKVDWSGAVRLVPELLDQPLRWRRPRRVFVNSMSDLFHESLPDDAIRDVFGIMGEARHHTFQVLTKRPARMLAFLSDPENRRLLTILGQRPELDVWPLPNVWLGVSVEDQATADARIPLLLDTPAAVRFVSYEPALGPVDLQRISVSGWAHCGFNSLTGVPAGEDRAVLPHLDWIIVGGESGPGARPFNVRWAHTIVNQCREAGVPVFVKQLGAKPFEPYSDGTPFADVRLQDRKGGDPQEWPKDLRVREFPNA